MNDLSFNIQPHTTSKSIFSAYNELLSDDQLNRKPAYQRSPVWSRDQKSNLIDSIMRNIPMPIFLLYMHGNTNECIDGQNRLTTIKQYMEQGAPVEDSENKELEPFPWVLKGDIKQYIFFDNKKNTEAMKAWMDKKNQMKSRKKSQTIFRFMNDEETRKF